MGFEQQTELIQALVLQHLGQLRLGLQDRGAAAVGVVVLAPPAVDSRPMAQGPQRHAVAFNEHGAADAGHEVGADLVPGFSGAGRLRIGMGHAASVTPFQTRARIKALVRAGR